MIFLTDSSMSFLFFFERKPFRLACLPLKLQLCNLILIVQACTFLSACFEVDAEYFKIRVDGLVFFITTQYSNLHYVLLHCSN